MHMARPGIDTTFLVLVTAQPADMVLTEHMPGLTFSHGYQFMALTRCPQGDKGILNVLQTLPLFIGPNLQRTYIG